MILGSVSNWKIQNYVQPVYLCWSLHCLTTATQFHRQKANNSPCRKRIFIDMTVHSFHLVIVVLVSLIAIIKMKWSAQVLLEIEFYVVDIGAGHELVRHIHYAAMCVSTIIHCYPTNWSISALNAVAVHCNTNLIMIIICPNFLYSTVNGFSCLAQIHLINMVWSSVIRSASEKNYFFHMQCYHKGTTFQLCVL